MRIRRTFALACSLVLVASIGTPARAASGDLDPTFSSDGIKLVPGVALSDVTVQPDGKVVVIGRTTGAVPRSLALRYTAAGELDPTFSGDGRMTLRIADPSDIALQTDGKIVVAGMTGPGELPELIAVERLTSRGARDLSFSGDGWVTTHLVDPWDGSFLWVTGLAIDTLGRITVVVESLEYPDNVDTFISLLAQWEPSGERRWAFGTDGVAWAKRCDEPGGLAVQADRKLVVAGVGSMFGPNTFDPCLTRLNTNGTLDGTFGTRGSTILGIGWDDARGVQVSPTDGSITALYDMEHGQVGRVLSTGQPDPTFGADGVVTGEPGDALEWWAVDLQARNVVLAGSSSGALAIARLTAAGTLDPTFGTDGIATVSGLGPARDVDVRAGAIVVLAKTTSGSAVVRFLA